MHMSFISGWWNFQSNKPNHHNYLFILFVAFLGCCSQVLSVVALILVALGACWLLWSTCKRYWSNRAKMYCEAVYFLDNLKIIMYMLNKSVLYLVTEQVYLLSCFGYFCACSWCLCGILTLGSIQRLQILYDHLECVYHWILFLTDPSMVCWLHALVTWPEEGSGVYPAPASGCNERGTARCWWDGCHAGPGSWLLHSLWRLQ